MSTDTPRSRSTGAGGAVVAGGTIVALTMIFCTLLLIWFWHPCCCCQQRPTERIASAISPTHGHPHGVRFGPAYPSAPTHFAPPPERSVPQKTSQLSGPPVVGTAAPGVAIHAVPGWYVDLPIHPGVAVWYRGGTNPGSTVSAPVDVPTPGSLGLFVLGLATIGVITRRKK